MFHSLKRLSAHLIAAGLVSAPLILSLNEAQVSAAPASSKITICHRTHSVTNPYRRITVSQSAVTRASGHKSHDEWSSVLFATQPSPNVFDPAVSYTPSPEKKWGDIIPDATAGGSASVALNFSDAGVAIYHGTSYNGTSHANRCGSMTAADFYSVEIAAGVAPADVLADLDDQAANEDYALLQALGGSFIGADPSSLTSVSATTHEATSVGASTATLPGTLAVGSTTTAAKFHYGTTTALGSEVSATPASVTDTTAVTAPLSGLTPGTTYFFRVVGVTNAGTDIEGEITGEILTFMTPLEDPTTTTSTVPASTTTSTVPETTTTVPETSTTVPETSTTVPETSTTVPETTTTTTPGTTTTTTPGTTTTTPAPPPAAQELGAVRGVIWIDMNRNGVQDLGEPGIPDTLVTLEPSRLPTEQERQTLSGGSSGQAASVNTSVRTDRSGAFSFSDVIPGAWVIRASLTGDSLARTSDSTGDADWVVPVSVVAKQVSNGDFAAAGGATLNATVLSSTQTAQVVWLGLDGTAGTSDDVVFTVRPENGRISLSGLPAGLYSIDQIAASGAVTRETAITVVEGVQQEYLNRSASPSLPTAGSETSKTLLAGLLAATAGIVLILAAKRRRISSVR